MKEFDVTFNKELRKGLRSDASNPRNNPELIECYNLKPDVAGLVPYAPVTFPFNGVVTDWPFPQLFIGQDVTILANATTVYEVDGSWNTSSKGAATEDQRWDFIDFGSYLILANGNKLCIRDYAGSWTNNSSLATMPRFSTGCNFKGQIVAGNVKSTWHDCGTGSLIWSGIGNVDFTPGGDNEAGFRNIPFEGDVLKVKRLGDFVIVYCENGVLALKPHEQTFGMTEILNVGIPTKGAIGGDEHSHRFIDTKGYLWKINSKLELTRLGYKEFMNLLTASEIVVEHDPGLREFHISDSTYGYLLTEFGLGQCYQRKSCVANLDGTAYGVFVVDSPYDTEGRLVTDIVDFGIRGMKSVELMEVGVNHTSGVVTGAVDWRQNKTDSFTRSDWTAMNPHGAVNVKVTADEFRLALKFVSYLGVDLDYITSKIKAVDKRYMRGPPAKNIADITG